MKRVAIVQSNYIPWKGYFDLIASVDEFVLYDDVQFTRRDWRNRNLIKTPQGVRWLTIPVESKGRYHQTIRETAIEGVDWAATHFQSLRSNYRRAPFFDEVASLIEPLYAVPASNLSDLNRTFLQAICDHLGITTRLTRSADYELAEERTERLASICAQAGADIYVSGPAAKEYLDEAEFRRRSMRVEWFDYSRYPEYPQLWGEFVHGVTMLDLLFNCGPEARNFMKATA
ncbi:WbqC family protein [Aurantimonas marina]|uniref:WbqC family protein n=1 Tax=Aurantimonas marina TaxID=2780508 RepID=UPI0019D076F4|nr:WbqC family protein [Aurantimonas marina]